jgi:hypothetical protein
MNGNILLSFGLNYGGALDALSVRSKFRRRGFDEKNSNMGMCVCYHAMQHLQASLWSHPTNWHEKLKRCVGKANFCP